MIEGIVTGYEPRFDFPPWAGMPRVSYLLAATPRSGSTYLSHLLWASGCLGAPLEYCNFEPGGPYGAAHGDQAAQMQLWQRVIATRTSANGVFGLKSFPAQLHHLQQINPPLLDAVMRQLLGSGSSRKVVELRRRNREAQAISYARALISGIWRAEQEQGGRDEPEYSAVALERAARMIEQQDAAWQAMYRDLAITPLVLEFEDAQADPQGTVAQVAAYLEVEIDANNAVDIPEIKRQSQSGAREWAARHSTSQG